MDRKAYSVQEVSALLGASEGTVRHLIATGVLRAVQPSGARARVFVPADSIDALLTAQTGADLGRGEQP